MPIPARPRAPWVDDPADSKRLHTALQLRVACCGLVPVECALSERKAANASYSLVRLCPVLVHKWEGWAQSRCRCGRGGPSPGADVGGVGPVPVQIGRAAPVLEQMWEGCACPSADVGGVGPVPVQMGE